MKPTDRERYDTWDELNPGYEHILLTDDRMETYVRDHFRDRVDISELYFEIQDPILRSDLIRYLVLLSSGGIYNDLDVACLKSISEWLPAEHVSENKIGILLGVEVDNKFGPDGRHFGDDGTDLFELVNWTIMSKPNQPFLSLLINRILETLRKISSTRDMPLGKIAFAQQDVLDTTGPAALTKAFFEYASRATASHVDFKNLTKMTDPMSFGEILVLPIHAFGAGHQVEWAGFQQDERKALVHHYFKGSWKETHSYGSTELIPSDGTQEPVKGSEVAAASPLVTKASTASFLQTQSNYNMTGSYKPGVHVTHPANRT